MTPQEYEGNSDYAEGYATALAQSADPAAYYTGQDAGRADTIHQVSSVTAPEYEGNPSYAGGYQEGASAAPYLSDVEAEQAAEAHAREEALAESLRYGMDHMHLEDPPDTSGQTVMGPDYDPYGPHPTERLPEYPYPDQEPHPVHDEEHETEIPEPPAIE